MAGAPEHSGSFLIELFIFKQMDSIPKLGILEEDDEFDEFEVRGIA